MNTRTHDAVHGDRRRPERQSQAVKSAAGTAGASTTAAVTKRRPGKVRPLLLAASSPANNPEYGLTIGYLLNQFPQPSQRSVLDEILALGRFGVNVHAFALEPPAGQAIKEAPLPVPAEAGAVPEPAFADEGCRNIVWGTKSGQGVVRPDAPERRTIHRQAQWIAREVVAKRIGHIHAELATAEVTREVKALTGVGYSLAATGHGILRDGSDADSVREIVDEAEFVIAPNNGTWKGLLTTVDPSAARKVLRMHPGVDLERVDFQPETGRDPNSVLAVCPLVDGNGLGDLIDAMGILCHRRSVAPRLTIVGEGELEQHLRAKIESLGLGGRITLLRRMAPSRLLSLMRAHAVMALPYEAAPDGYRDGSVPSVLLEAMAVGLPVVSTLVAGVTEVLEDGWTGRLVDPRYPQGLAGALETLLDNLRLRVRIANRARQVVERRFALSQNVSVLAGLFAIAAGQKQLAT